MIRRISPTSLAFGWLAAGLACAGSNAAHAQGGLGKNFVFTEKAGFVAGERSTISASYSSVYPDPLGRFVLIGQKDGVLPTDERLAGATVAVTASSLLLYDARTGRTKLLWRSDPSVDRADILSISWLNGADAALVVTAEGGDPSTGLMPDGRKTQASVHLVRPASAGSAIRTVLESTGYVSVNASPTLPVAVVNEMKVIVDGSGKTEFLESYCTVTDRGIVGDPIALDTSSLSLRHWSADGASTYFVQRIPANPGLEGAPATPEQRRWFSYNVTTRALAPLDKRPAETEVPLAPDTNPLKLVSGALIAPPPGATGRQPTAKPAKFAPLWLVRADGKREGRLPTATVIAPDAQESILLADDSAVLYLVDHTVYAVPLSSERRPDFDAVYRGMLQKQTMSNAKQLGLAMIGYSQDYDEKLPAAGNLMSTIGPYCKNLDIFNNPDTDSPAFTYLLNGQSQAAMSSPATTQMGYLGGPGGRAIVWGDGHVTWEDGP